MEHPFIRLANAYIQLCAWTQTDLIEKHAVEAIRLRTIMLQMLRKITKTSLQGSELAWLVIRGYSGDASRSEDTGT